MKEIMNGFKDNGKLKLLIIVGTRPEIIRLAAVINKCRQYFDCLLAHTGQNYDYNLNGVFFKDLKLADPDIYMEAVGDDLGATMGNIIDKSYKVMVETKPDAVLVLGDTNSCLSVIGAKRLHIPIFHMEAGNRCKDECLPEETNRRIVDIISDVNMAYSEHARRYLADCGLPKERTYVTGSPMAEVLHQNLAEIEASDIHQRLGLEKGKYILLSAHREENIDTEKNFLSLFTAINKMAEKYDMPILYSCHPRSRKRLEQSGFQLDKRVIQHEPLGFHDYNCLQMNAFAVVSDSGTLPEESSFFTSVGHPFPAICIRTSTERPEALDKACFFIAGIDEKSLLQAVDTAVTMNQNGDYGIPVPDYIEENVSTKVVKIIQSYVGIVNKMVWRNTRQQSVMVQMPTGTGKTYLMAEVVAHPQPLPKGGEPRVLVVAHRIELIEQISQTLDRFGIDHGLIVSGKPIDATKRVQVASIQTLTRRLGHTEPPARKLRSHPSCAPWRGAPATPSDDTPPTQEGRTTQTTPSNDTPPTQEGRIDFSLIIIDEAHHAVAETYRMLWDRWPEARFLGLTATPCRLNGAPFTDLFDTLLQSWSIREFIQKGWLSDLDYVSVRSDSIAVRKVASLNKRGADGDYQTKQAALVLDTEESIEHLYRSYKEFADGKKGIVYAINREHARHIAEYYSERGLRCAVIDSKTPAKERQRIVEGYKASPPAPLQREGNL